MESGASGLNESTNEAATVSNDLKNGAASWTLVKYQGHKNIMLLEWAENIASLVY